MVGSYVNTLVFSRLKLAANPWPLVVNSTSHGISIQGRTPAILQSRHNPSPPFIGLDKMTGDTRLANEHDFQAATARLAVGTAHFWFRKICDVDCHEAINLYHFA